MVGKKRRKVKNRNQEKTEEKEERMIESEREEE